MVQAPRLRRSPSSRPDFGVRNRAQGEPATGFSCRVPLSEHRMPSQVAMAKRTDRTHLDDAILASRASAGDLHAQSELVGRYAVLAGAIVRGFVRPNAEYDDLEAIGMTGLLKATRIYDPARGVPFAAFARACIKNELRDALKRQDLFRSGPAGFARCSIDDALGACDPSARDPHDAALAAEIERAAQTAMRQFNPRHREWFRRVTIGHTMREVAALDGVSKQAVSQAVLKIRQRVLEALETP